MPFEDPEENEENKENNDEAITKARSFSDSDDLTAGDAANTGVVQGEGTGPTIGQRIMQIGRQPWQQQAGSVEQFFGGRPRFWPKAVAENSRLGGEAAGDGTADRTNSPFTVDRRTLPMFRAKFGQASASTQTSQENNPIPVRRSPGKSDDVRTLTEESSRPPLSKIAASMRPREIAGEMRGMANVTVPGARNENINRYFPLILDSLRSQGFNDLGFPDLLAYSLATIHSENGGFEPLVEPSNRSNTTVEGRPFDIYENPEHQRRLGNTEPGDGERFRGRGFIQLTGRANYADMGRRLGFDLVGNPDLASDPQIAAKIFAQYLKDREFTKDERPGLSETLGRSPDAQGALQLYIDSLRDLNNQDPEVRRQLAHHDLVRARVVVNGSHNGLPNGLENFLPAFHFGRQYLKLIRTSAQNPDLTVKGAADIWTEGDPLGYRGSYLTDLKKQLGADLNTKVSALNAQQRQTVDRAQQNYVRRVENEIDRLRREKIRAQRRGRAQ